MSKRYYTITFRVDYDDLIPSEGLKKVHKQIKNLMKALHDSEEVYNPAFDMSSPIE